jgi:hypothetical protein
LLEADIERKVHSIIDEALVFLKKIMPEARLYQLSSQFPVVFGGQKAKYI